ncbi:MAG: hypothetical protein S4CHLAM102_02720 [Chlamydiia bacterium]|nr:hypothetical protein [Chlamydiia bacterium]
MNAEELARKYYETIAAKKIDELPGFFDDEVSFRGPMARETGRERVVEATIRFTQMVESLEIVFVSGNEDGAMVVYEAKCADPIGTIRAAAYIVCVGDKIGQLELFYDASPFMGGMQESLGEE